MSKEKHQVVLNSESKGEVIQLQALKQIVTGKKISGKQIIEDLLKLKKQLPYYSIATKKLAGISSHSEKAENKRNKTKRNKTTKKKSKKTKR